MSGARSKVTSSCLLVIVLCCMQSSLRSSRPSLLALPLTQSRHVGRHVKRRFLPQEAGQGQGKHAQTKPENYVAEDHGGLKTPREEQVDHATCRNATNVRCEGVAEADPSDAILSDAGGGEDLLKQSLPSVINAGEDTGGDNEDEVVGSRDF